MLYEEFEKIAGYRVSYDDYTNIIEPMYSATNLNKYDFAKCIDRRRFELPEETEEMVNIYGTVATLLYYSDNTVKVQIDGKDLKHFASAEKAVQFLRKNGYTF